MRLHRHDEIVKAITEAIGVARFSSIKSEHLATAALDALLDAAVKLGVGKREPSHKELHFDSETSNFYHTYFPAFILRLEASDDK